MTVVLLIACVVSSLSLTIWVWLLIGRGRFWRTDHHLTLSPIRRPGSLQWPSVRIVVPARNETRSLPKSLPSLLKQDYPGAFGVLLVDDGSEDDTADTARRIAERLEQSERFTVIAGKPLPPGWTGKLWALQQGIQADLGDTPEFLLLTDADISHSPDSLRNLVFKAQHEGLDLVSLMAQLRAENLWEYLLVPAYVFFFAMLYPFRWVKDPNKSTAAAAGGCILIRRDVLLGVGGVQPIAGRVIDDCALAKLVKGRKEASVWLGLTHEVRSLRSYSGLSGIWATVARTAFAQLDYSTFNLLGTILGMFLVYMAPPLAWGGGLIAVGMDGGLILSLWLTSSGFSAWLIMSLVYSPMLRWYKLPLVLAPLLPLTAALYTAMTFDSALLTWRGRGGGWKGRTY